MNRTQTKQIHVGSVAIGGGAPVAVQSMCNTHTSDARATIEQIARLHDAGCEIIRLAVPDQAAADALPEIVHASPIPVVADIHFDYRLALAAAKAGVHKIRINPGNIGEPDNVRKVAEACRERGIPIRIGVNGGSLEKRLLEKYGHPTPEALVESAQGHIDLLHRYTQIDLIALAQEVEQRLQGLEREITVAVMGCVVNGPGEAHEADYGIAGGKDCGLLFRRGEILGKYPADKLADALVDLILSEK